MNTAIKPWLRNEAHGNWKGDNVGLVALHDWVRRRLGTPTTCEFCGFSTPNTKLFDWSNISGEYKRDLSDWQRLCKKCHMNYDNVGIRSAQKRKANYDYYIAQFDLENNFVDYFISVEDASRQTGILRTSISNNLSDYAKSAGNYIWRRINKWD